MARVVASPETREQTPDCSCVVENEKLYKSCFPYQTGEATLNGWVVASPETREQTPDCSCVVENEKLYESCFPYQTG